LITIGHGLVQKVIPNVSYVMPDMQRDAALRVDAALRAAIQNRDQGKVG
jgi:hypothetical protein